MGSNPRFVVYCSNGPGHVESILFVAIHRSSDAAFRTSCSKWNKIPMMLHISIISVDNKPFFVIMLRSRRDCTVWVASWSVDLISLEVAL